MNLFRAILVAARPRGKKIVAVAAELFHARSDDGVGVNDIRRHPGVVKGSFYHFSASGDDLVLVVIDAHWTENPPESGAGSDRAGIVAGADRGHVPAFRQYGPPDRTVHRAESRLAFGNLVVELSTRHEAIRRRIAAIFDEQARIVQPVLDGAAAAGQIDPTVGTAVAARAMVTCIHGLAVMGKTFDDTSMLDDLMAPAMNLAGAGQSA